MELARVLAARRSGRAFVDRPVEPAQIERLLEAARWAPSAVNRQPWRFVVVDRDAPTRAGVEAALDAGNAWARRAPLLIVACAQRPDPPRPRDTSRHDLGLATMSLILRAVDLGLRAHPMGGWAEAPLRQAVALPADFEPVTVVAIGYPGRPEDLDPETRAKDERPRTRRPLGEIASAGRFTTPYPATLRSAPPRYFECDIPLRFRDIDAMGHVNNAVTVTLLEQARVHFFAALFGVRGLDDFPFILAELALRYLRPIRLPDRVQARVHVTEVMRSSYRLHYQLRDPGDGSVFAEGETVQVSYDYQARRPRPHGPELLALLDPYLAG
jgi:acyl-CoA thioesterase FadM/nitroreductase